MRFRGSCDSFRVFAQEARGASRYGAESGAGNDKEEAAFDGEEGIILRLTEKFGVVREGEMPRRESEPTQLGERGVSVIRLLLPPTSELLLLVVMAFLHHPEKKAGVSAHLLDLTVDIESGDHAEKSRLSAGRRTSSVVKIPS